MRNTFAKANQVNRLMRLAQSIQVYVGELNRAKFLKHDDSMRSKITSRIHHRVEQYQAVFTKVYGHKDSLISNLVIFK
jgi:hypothetical protein